MLTPGALDEMQAASWRDMGAIRLDVSRPDATMALGEVHFGGQLRLMLLP